MCAWLEVSRSGYYKLAVPAPVGGSRPPADDHGYFTESDETYGYRRIHADLVDEGTEASPELVRQIMRDEGLYPCQPRPKLVTTTPDEHAADIPDLVQRDFTAARPGVKFVGDITYIPTWEGFAH